MTDESTDAAILSPGERLSARLGPRRRFDEAVLRVCTHMLARSAIGRLHLTLPSGAAAIIDGARPGAEARLVLRSYDAFWRSLRRGSIGFAESYMLDHLDCDDLVALFAY